MYTKFLIVSLVQVALARHIWTEYNTGQFRYPGGENQEVHSFDTYLDGNYRSGYEPYVDNNNHATFQHGRPRAINYGIQKHERPEVTVNRQNSNRRDRYIDGTNSRDETYFEMNLNHANQRQQRINNQNNNRARFQKCDQTGHVKQDTLKTNLDTQSNVSDSSSNETAEYSNGEEIVKTNEKSNNNSDDTTVVGKSARTNIHSRYDDTQSSNDSLPEVRSNGDSMVFIDIENPKLNEPAKTTTDNELRYNTNDDNKEDKWVWGDGSTTQPTTTTTATTTKTNTTLPNKTDSGSDLDDRTSFNGDACPKGQAKVLGLCVDKH